MSFAVPVSLDSLLAEELLFTGVTVKLQFAVGMNQEAVCLHGAQFVAEVITVIAVEFLLVFQLKVLLLVTELHVLLQSQVEPELLVADLAGDKSDLLDDDGDGPVDDGHQLGVVEAVEVGDQHLLVGDDLHADLTPELSLLAVVLLLEVTPEVCVPVTVELTGLALEGRLADDVPDVVQDDPQVVRVSEGPVVVVVRHQVFPVLRSRHPGPAAPALHK